MKTVMRANEAGYSHTKLSEGFRTKAYLDTRGIPTIGYGHAATNPRAVRGMLNGEFYEGRVCEGLTITQAEAERLFAEDAAEVEAAISAVITQEISQGLMNAMFDWTFQFGPKRLEICDLVHMINFNPNSEKVEAEFLRWNKAGGVPDEAIYRRRLRGVCLMRGKPVPAALWRKAPFALTPDGHHIDPSRTLSVAAALDLASKSGAAPKFEPDAPWPDPLPNEQVADDTLPPADAPPPLDVPDTELFDQDPEPEAKPTVPSPAVVAEEAPAEVSKSTSQQLPAPTPAPKPVVLPPVVTDPGPEIPPVKDMLKSRRYWGQFLQSFGHIFQTIGVTGPIGAGPLAVGFGKAYGVVVRDPFLFELVITIAIFTTGWAMTHVGTWVKKFGEKHATAPLGTSREVAVAKAVAT